MISSIIRKISVGPDYKDAMHFQIGQTVIKGKASINTIIKNPTNGQIDIYVESGDEIHLWKSINSTIPVSLEYDIEL